MKITRELFNKSLSIKTEENILNKEKLKRLFSTWKIDKNQPLVFTTIGEELERFYEYVSGELENRKCDYLKPMFFDPISGEVKENKEYEANTARKRNNCK